MLLNLLKLLHSAKHDKWFFVRKWYSKNSGINFDINEFCNSQIYKKFFMEKMQLTSQQALELLQKNTYIFRVPLEKIVQTCEICQNYNVNMNHQYTGRLHLFRLNADELTSRILILQEIGAQNIVPVMLNSYFQYTNINIFRVYGQVDLEINMKERLFSFLLDSMSLMPQLPNLNEDVSIKEYRSQCLTHYFQWKLKIPPEDKLTLTKLVSKTLHMNFGKLRKSHTVLHEIVGISIESLRNPIFLQHCSPDHLICIIECIKTVCNVPIVDLIHSTPALCEMDYENVVIIKHILEKYNYSAQQLINCPTILLTDHDDLIEMLNIVNSRPDLQIFQTHPDILNIYSLKKEFKIRVEYLEYLKVQTIPTSVFKPPAHVFDRISKTGKFEYKSHEVHWVIQKFIPIDKVDAISLLKKHPFWNKIYLADVYDTLEFLTNIFDCDAIKNNLYIILYPREKIKKTLLEIINTYNVCSAKNPFTTTQILALCEYEMEKKNHFTGDGVWGFMEQTNQLISLKLKTFLNDKRKMKHFFRNNPDDYFYIEKKPNNNCHKYVHNVNKMYKNNNNNSEEASETHNYSHNHKYISKSGRAKLQLTNKV